MRKNSIFTFIFLLFSINAYAQNCTLGQTVTFVQLPSPVIAGTSCKVTDANECTAGHIITAGGGSLTCSVRWTGSSWLETPINGSNQTVPLANLGNFGTSGNMIFDSGTGFESLTLSGDICENSVGTFTLCGQEGLPYSGSALPSGTAGLYKCTDGSGHLVNCQNIADPGTAVGDIPDVSATGTPNTYGRIAAGALNTPLLGAGAGVVPAFSSLLSMQWTKFVNHAAAGTYTWPTGTTVGIVISVGAGGGGAGGGGADGGGGGGANGPVVVCLAFASNGNLTVTPGAQGTAGTNAPGNGQSGSGTTVTGSNSYACSAGGAHGGTAPSGTTGGAGGTQQTGSFPTGAYLQWFLSASQAGSTGSTGAGAAGGAGAGAAGECGAGGAGNAASGTLVAGNAGTDGCVFIGAI